METSSAPLLTVQDVCGRLRAGKSKVFEYISTGELESLKLGASRRVTEEALRAFIARQAAASKASA